MIPHNMKKNKPVNKVFIATSMDGYIADRDGGIGWLDTIPEINTIDSGYDAFTSEIDAFVFGRVTFETVCSFDMDWFYTKPVFVVSNTLEEIPQKYKGKAFLIKGTVLEILAHIHQKGYYRLYIDGGGLIQNFLKEDMIDELVITTIPVLLGGGTPLFSSLSEQLHFECKRTTLYLDAIVQNHYVRKRQSL